MPRDQQNLYAGPGLPDPGGQVVTVDPRHLDVRNQQWNVGWMAHRKRQCLLAITGGEHYVPCFGQNRFEPPPDEWLVLRHEDNRLSGGGPATPHNTPSAPEYSS